MSGCEACRLLNWVPAALLRSPLHRFLSGKILLFEYAAAQVSGTPINYRQVGERLLVSTDSPWYRNFTSAVGNMASVILRGRPRAARVELVTNQDDAVEAWRLNCQLARGGSETETAFIALQLWTALHGMVDLRTRPTGSGSRCPRSDGHG